MLGFYLGKLFRQAEVRDLGYSIRCKQHIGWLQIPVNDADLVGVMHGASQCLEEVSGLKRGQGHCGKSLLQVATGYVLQRKVGTIIVNPDFIDLHNMRMLKRSSGFRLPAKTCQIVGRGKLTRQNHL